MWLPKLYVQKKKNQKLFFGNQSKQVQTEPGDGAGGGERC